MRREVFRAVFRGELMSFIAAVIAAFSVIALTGCAAPPTAATRPAVDMPDAFKQASTFRPARPASTVPDEWWRAFEDPVLDGLQAQLLAGNQDLQSALAQYRASQAALAFTRSGLFPVVGFGAAATRSSSPPLQEPANNVSLVVSAAWELDLWGRVAAQVDGAQARLDASGADVAAARLSLQSALAQTYFLLRAAEVQEALLDSTVTAYARSVELTQSRYQSGVVSAADVAQAQTQLSNAQANRVDARSSRAQFEHAIAVLLGKPPSLFSLPVTARLPALPGVPVQLPSHLLQRRPDIAAAERRVAAAQAQVGAARAAFFPEVVLSASAGYRGDTLARLLSAPNLFWSVGPAIALAAFDGGARQAGVDAARAAADQATAAYRQTVLVALQEVEDNLVIATMLQDQLVHLDGALVAARRALDISTDQYRGGIVSFLNVVTAQAATVAAERNVLDARTRSLFAANQLLKNIAGRWDVQAPVTAEAR